MSLDDGTLEQRDPRAGKDEGGEERDAGPRGRNLLGKVVLPLVVVIVAAGVAAVVATSKPEVERQVPEVLPPLVRVIEAHRSDVALDVASQGTVEPRTESTLVAQVAGRILSVSPDFAEGSFVSEGQVLVRIDPADYELAVEQTQAQVAQAEVQLQMERAEAELARQEWKDLGRGEPTALASRKPQVQEAEAALASAPPVWRRRSCGSSAPGCARRLPAGCGANRRTSGSPSVWARRWLRSSPPIGRRSGCRCPRTSSAISVSIWRASTARHRGCG